MNEYTVTHIVIQPDRSSLLYSERETSVISHLSLGALRHLRTVGLIEGEVVDGQRRYHEADIIQLRRIRRLHQDLGINLAGVEVIMHLLARLDSVHNELEQGRDPYDPYMV
jgi:MerR family transcriptional regulator/heat shock protein HspR